MLVLGILLIVIGLAVALLLPHPHAGAVGALLVILGLILLVLALVPLDGHHRDAVVGLPVLFAKLRRRRIRSHFLTYLGAYRARRRWLNSRRGRDAYVHREGRLRWRVSYIDYHGPAAPRRTATRIA